MQRPLKIVVGGYAVGCPLGGQLWMVSQWVAGLARLGHDVIFVEDSSNWAMPFNPRRRLCSLDSGYGRACLEDALSRHGLGGRWSYHNAFEDVRYGMPWEAVEAFCHGADLFLNVSGVIPLDPAFLRARVRAVVDTDPVGTQFRLAHDPWLKDYYAAHDIHFTFGQNIPDSPGRIPSADFAWQPTRQPVLLDMWEEDAAPARQGFSTVGHWTSDARPVPMDGKALSASLRDGFAPLEDLPSRLPGVPLEMAMNNMKQDAQRFAQAGWIVHDSLEACRELDDHRAFIAGSAGQFSPCPQQQVGLASGWISDVSACYLAAGRPVVVQDTGLNAHLPTDGGLVAFDAARDATDALRAVLDDYPRHSALARRIAREYFDSATVLGQLLRRAGLSS